MAQRSGTNPTQLGNERRTDALPVGTGDKEVESLGPPYDYAGMLPNPRSVGVRPDNTLGSVVDAMKGGFYYMDMIGFGQSSSPLTSGMPLYPMGVNFFTKTGAKCSNGQDMYTYVNGIPSGDILGPQVKAALADQGLPGLRGLSMGILEDARDALNPLPIINTVMGTGYARCKQEEKPIGDTFGRLGANGATWIPQTSDMRKGNDGKWYQKKWVLDKWISKEEYDAEVAQSKRTVSGFVGSIPLEASLPATLLVCLAAALYMRYS